MSDPESGAPAKNEIFISVELHGRKFTARRTLDPSTTRKQARDKVVFEALLLAKQMRC